MSAPLKVFTPRPMPRKRTRASAPHTASEIFRSLGIAKDRAELVQQIQHGLAVTVIEKLADELQLPQQALLKVARIAPATLTRRRKSAAGLLSPAESDRIYRIAEAYRSALQLFEGSADLARRWLAEPAKALGGVSPLQRLDTEAGASEVRDLVGRLEHGVYT